MLATAEIQNRQSHVFVPRDALQVRAIHRQSETILALFVLAGILTGLNCLKPIHVDDAAYITYASHIAKKPLAPYDFTIYWDYQFHQANHILAPPVLLYWLGGAAMLLGDDPLLWKLSLLPFHLALAMSLFALLRRWASPLAMPLTWMAVLSPAILPGTNLMLDVPALALSLAALAIYAHGCDRQSFVLAIVSGLIAGLAIQTKYTALVTLAVMIAFGGIHKRMGLAFIALTIGAAAFAAWELVVFLGQGESHFMAALQQRHGGFESRVRHLLLPTLSLTAALAPGVFLTAILSRNQPGRWLAVGILGHVGGFLLIGTGLGLDAVLYVVLAILWWCFLAVSVWQRLASAASDSPESRWSKRVLGFLVLWLVLEIAFSLVLSPFAASRRVLGITVAATVLVGHLAAFYRPSRGLIWTAAVTSIVLGVAVALVDIREAHATQELAEKAVRIVNQQSGEGRTWFSGIWAFQYYAMRHGMLPLDFNESNLHAGDLLILADQQLRQTYFWPAHAPIELFEEVTIEDRLPWRTLVCYYAGATPVRYHDGPRLSLRAYRVLADFSPRDHLNLPVVK